MITDSAVNILQSLPYTKANTVLTNSG